MTITKYALNGINVLVEWEDRLAQPLRRASSGTRIRQNSGSENWFHFAPTTPIEGFQPDRNIQLWLDRIKLRGSLNEAAIEKVHIRYGRDLLWSLDDDSRLPIASTEINEMFPSERRVFREVLDDLGIARLSGFKGFCLSIKVKFDGSPGEVTFESAEFDFYLL